MATEAEAMRQRVEVLIEHYRELAKSLPPGIPNEVEDLAQRTSDRVLANFFREIADPKYIQQRVDAATTRLKIGDVAEAYNILEMVERNIAFLRQNINARALRVGRQFVAGSRKPRQDALNSLIVIALEKLGRDASAKKVWRHVVENGDSVIVCTRNDTIEWRRPNGKISATSAKKFADRVSRIRNLYFPA